VIHINEDLCSGCGLCGEICPRRIPYLDATGDKKVSRCNSERADICIHCGHCALVCKQGAVVVEGMGEGDVMATPPMQVSKEQLFSLLQHRRSVRRFKKQAVPRELLEQVAESAHFAPLVASSGTLGVMVIDDLVKLRAISDILVELYEGLLGALSNPIGRFIVKRKVGDRYATVTDFLKPALEWYLRWYKEGAGDEIIRDAPAVMLFHAPRSEPDIEISCAIAAWNAVLTAEALGLGSLYNGFLPDGVNRSPKLREYLALPPKRNVFAGLSLGFPKFKLKRTVRRNLSEIRFV
jgi:nitroreductase/NAD-dependent dihydropyrimidine dehydrogenase PreA subunit